MVQRHGWADISSVSFLSHDHVRQIRFIDEVSMRNIERLCAAWISLVKCWHLYKASLMSWGILFRSVIIISSPFSELKQVSFLPLLLCLYWPQAKGNKFNKHKVEPVIRS